VGARSLRLRPSAGWLRWPAGLMVWWTLGFGWWTVASRGAQASVRVAGALAVLALLVLLITLLWIRWNRRIYQLKGPRRQVVAPQGGRLAIESSTRRASEIVLRVTPDGLKTYEPVEVGL